MRSLLFILLIMALLAGCGRSENKAVEEKSRLFGVTFQNLNNPFFLELNESIKECLELRGDQLITLGADYDAVKEKNAIADLILQKVDGVFINPVDSAGIKESLLLLKKAKIPCIIIDAPVDDADLVLSQVASDNVEAGRQAARALARKNSKARVVVLQSSQNKACVARVEGFLDEVRKTAGISVLGAGEAVSTEEGARPVIIEMLKKFPACDSVFAVNDPTALAVIAAIELAGKAGKITVVSVDGSKEGIKAVKKGNLEATSAQFPRAMGRIAAEQMYEHLNGKPVEKEIKTPVELITVLNASDFRAEVP